MLFLESWLRSLVNPNMELDEISDILTMAGLEVEEVRLIPQIDPGIVVAKIIKVIPLPKSNKLKICSVDDGGIKLVQVICGASNAVEGLSIPLAKIGVNLPTGHRVLARNIFGLTSFGMLCSGADLNLSEDSSKLLEIPSETHLGKPIYELMELFERVLSVNITPNRGDCLSMIGLAREVSALTNSQISYPAIIPIEVSIKDYVHVDIQEKNLCGRFSGRVIKNVNIDAEIPTWMKNRLENSNYPKSASVLLDITNYVMLETGLPAMIFNHDKVRNGFLIRWAKDKEIFTSSSGHEFLLDSNIGIISIGGKVQGLAGVHEYLSESICASSKDIYIGTGFWWPDSISGYARRYRINSDSNFRFERGIDYEKIPECIEFISHLILNICGGEAGPIYDQCFNLPKRNSIYMRMDRCCRTIGCTVTQSEIERIFSLLNFEFKIGEDGKFLVKSPSYRFDLKLEEDLIEEVARIYGYENIPEKLPSISIDTQNTTSNTSETLHSEHQLRYLMATRDYHEVINYSFVSHNWEKDYSSNLDPIRLLNPISTQASVMRSTLIPGLISNICYNLKRNQTRVRVFEIGRVFMRNDLIQESSKEVVGVSQLMHLAGAAWGNVFEEHWDFDKRLVDFYDVKGDIESLFGLKKGKLRFLSANHPALHPGKSALISLHGSQNIGWLGQLHPALVEKEGLKNAPFVFELDLSSISEKIFPKVADFSNQPFVTRDLSLSVDSFITAQSMIDEIYSLIEEGSITSIIQHVYVSDVWSPDSKNKQLRKQEKSLTFRFFLQDPTGSLREKSISDCINQVQEKLIERFKANKRQIFIKN